MFPVISPPRVVLGRLRLGTRFDGLLTTLHGPVRWVDVDAPGRAATLPVGAAPALLVSYLAAVVSAAVSTVLVARGGHPVAASLVAVASIAVVVPEAVLVGVPRRIVAVLLGHRAAVRAVALLALGWIAVGHTPGIVAAGFGVIAGAFGVESAVIRRLLGARGERVQSHVVLVRGLAAAAVVVSALWFSDLGLFTGREWVVAGSAGGLASVVAFVVGERGSAWCLARAADRQRQALAQQRARDLRDVAGWMHDEVANPVRVMRLRLSSGAASIDELTEELDRLEHAVREGQLARLVDAGVSRIGELAQPALRRAERHGVVIAEMPNPATSSTVVAGPDGRLVARLIAGFVSNATNAGASEIRLRVAVDDDSVTVEVEDDAGGFDSGPAHVGRGLDDLARMVAEHNGGTLLRDGWSGGPSFARTATGTIARAIVLRSAPPIG